MSKLFRLSSNYAKPGENYVYGGYDDESGMSASKERFLKDARRMLSGVRRVLDRHGYFTSIKINRGGPAVSGEASAHIWRESQDLLYVQIGSSPQMGRPTDGVYILVQCPPRRGGNLWLDANMFSSDELAAKLYRMITGGSLP